MRNINNAPLTAVAVVAAGLLSGCASSTERTGYETQQGNQEEPGVLAQTWEGIKKGTRWAAQNTIAPKTNEFLPGRGDYLNAGIEEQQRIVSQNVREKCTVTGTAIATLLKPILIIKHFQCPTTQGAIEASLIYTESEFNNPIQKEGLPFLNGMDIFGKNSELVPANTTPSSQTFHNIALALLENDQTRSSWGLIGYWQERLGSAHTASEALKKLQEEEAALHREEDRLKSIGATANEIYKIRIERRALQFIIAKEQERVQNPNLPTMKWEEAITLAKQEIPSPSPITGEETRPVPVKPIPGLQRYPQGTQRMQAAPIAPTRSWQPPEPPIVPAPAPRERIQTEPLGNGWLGTKQPAYRTNIDGIKPLPKGIE